MPKITLTYNFESNEELIAFLDGTSPAPAPESDDRAAAPVVAVVPPYTPGERQAVADMQTAVSPEAVADATRAAEPEITGNTDADGLPYDPEIHATPKSQTADGMWRAKRGKSAEANAARAAFKAGGGALTPPVAAVMPTAPVMPGMTVARAAAPEPITYDKLFDKTMGMMTRAKISADDVMGLYAKIGLTDPAVLETNESMRAALYTLLSDIEPDMA